MNEKRKTHLSLKDKMRKLFTNVWTIPNVLTMIRLLLVPVFVVLFLKGHKMASLGVFIAASLTDMLDGYLARKLNQITDFGKLFDPLADKLMVLSAMVCQGIAGVFPWSAIIIVACKELFMVIGGLLMLKNDVVVYSNYVGKAAQVCFILSLVLAFFHDELAARGVQLDIILLWMTVALALCAMVIYSIGAVRTIRKRKAEDGGQA
jgi:CDP-diacylglycerol--glycerol-3-phosphate 3-phosphatidyltransferase